jgi:hypothetical protein
MGLIEVAVVGLGNDHGGDSRSPLATFLLPVRSLAPRAHGHTKIVDTLSGVSGLLSSASTR